MVSEKIELIGGVDIGEDVKKKLTNVGLRGIDVKKAKELGVFERIGYLLCLIHTSVAASYMIYGEVDSLISMINARRNDVSRAMNEYDKAFDKFFKFFTDFYSHDRKNDMASEVESLQRQLYMWSQLPEHWQLGDEQRTNDDTDVMIRIDDERFDRILTFHRCVVETEQIEEPAESWCVTKYMKRIQKQEVVNVDMDKASAMMVAKRLSAEDHENIYTASVVNTISERRAEVIPCKAFFNNETIGSIKKTIKTK